MDRNVITREQQLQAGFATPSAFNETLTSAENQTLTSVAQNAGIEEPTTTPTIDVSTIQTPQTSVVESPAEITGGTINSIENQIRAIAGIDTTSEIDNTENIIAALGEGTANIQRELGNQPREQARLEEEAGLPELRKQQRDITSQMSALQAQLTADIETITEKGREEGSLAFASSGERARRARQAAAEMAGLSAINQALQGNIATAQEYVTQAMDIKYSALEGELNAQQTLLQLNQNKMTRQEKRLAEKKQTEISLLQSRLEEQRMREHEASDSLITAMENGLDPNKASDLMRKLQNGEISPDEVYRQTGAYQVDQLDRLLKQAQLNNINSQISERDNKTTKDLTASQYQALGYGERMLSSSLIIDEVGSQFTDFADRISGSFLFPEGLKSEDRQRYEQAQRNFVNAVLRRESGAAISPEEFESARTQYFPQPGDKIPVLIQKKQNRDMVTRNFLREAGVNTEPINQSLNDPLGIGITQNQVDPLELNN